MTSDENGRPTERDLQRIALLAQNARATWFTLLGVLAFAGVTLLGVDDADFFAFGRETALPLVGVTIPTRSFFWTAPLLMVALHVYLHVQLRELWRTFGRVVDADREELVERLPPGLLIDYGLDLAHPPGPDVLRTLQRWVTALLVGWAGPLVLLAFWWRSMPGHAEGLTLTVGLLLALATFVALQSRFEARAYLTRSKGPARTGLRHVAFALLGAAVLVVGWAKTEGGLDHRAERAIVVWNGLFPARAVLRDAVARRAWIAEQAWLPRARLPEPDAPPLSPRRLLALAPADLAGATLVPRPVDWRDHDIASDTFRDRWCRERGVCGELSGWQRTEFEANWRAEREATLANLRGLDLAGADLRAARLAGVFAPGISLRWARLDGADLRGARLEGVDLAEASLQGARLDEARLETARLAGARLEGADLSAARLDGASLRGAVLDGADFGGARLDGAQLALVRGGGVRLATAGLRGASLRGADLPGADLTGADLLGARLGGVGLRGARLANAKLGSAELVGAALVAADLDGAGLQRAVLVDADLRGALLRGAVLEAAEVAGARFAGAVLHDADVSGVAADDLRLEGAIGNDGTILPPGVAIAHCWNVPPPTLEATLAQLPAERRAAARAHWLCNGRAPKAMPGDPAALR